MSEGNGGEGGKWVWFEIGGEADLRRCKYGTNSSNQNRRRVKWICQVRLSASPAVCSRCGEVSWLTCNHKENALNKKSCFTKLNDELVTCP